MQTGGSSMINGAAAPQLLELTRIIGDSSKIYAFIDSEKASPEDQLAEDRQAFVAECQKIGIKIKVSNRRATENYLEENGIRKAMKDNNYRPLSEFQKLKDSQKPWKKSDNWRIARETEFEI